MLYGYASWSTAVLSYILPFTPLLTAMQSGCIKCHNFKLALLGSVSINKGEELASHHLTAELSLSGNGFKLSLRIRMEDYTDRTVEITVDSKCFVFICK